MNFNLNLITYIECSLKTKISLKVAANETWTPLRYIFYFPFFYLSNATFNTSGCLNY